MSMKYSQRIIVDSKTELASITSADVGQSAYAKDSRQNLVFNGTDWVSTSSLFTQSADKTVTNTTADTSSIGTGNGSLLLPANFWYPGRQIRVSGGGIYTTPLSSNVTTKVKLGSNTIATSVTNGMLNSQTNARWNFEILIACRSVGTTGAFRVSGRLLFDIGGTSPAGQFIGTNVTTPETADTTVAALLDVTNSWDQANANRSVTTTTAVFEVLN